MLQPITRWGAFALMAGALIVHVPDARAQEKKDVVAKPKLDRLSGSVHMIDKANNTIEIRRGTVHRRIIFTPTTKWTAANKPGSMADLQEGSRIVAVGHFDDKNRLLATRVEVSRR